MPYKILCCYHHDENEGPTFLEPDPLEVLDYHDVTIVDNYNDAWDLLSIPAQRFDVILADAYLPQDGRAKNKIVSSTQLVTNLACSVKGIGIFLPDWYERTYVEFFCGRCVILQDRTCWTCMDKRDWQRLLGRVEEMIGEYIVV